RTEFCRTITRFRLESKRDFLVACPPWRVTRGAKRSQSPRIISLQARAVTASTSGFSVFRRIRAISRQSAVLLSSTSLIAWWPATPTNCHGDGIGDGDNPGVQRQI